MIKVKFLIDNSDESNYKYEAIERFNEYVRHNKLKDKHYKNGTRSVWFSVGAYKHGSYLINGLSFESIPIEVTGLKKRI